MSSGPIGFDALYSVLCQDIHDFSTRVGRVLPDSFTGVFPEPTADYSAHEVAALALAKNIGKKSLDTLLPNAGEKCLLSFLESNDSCRTWRLVETPTNPNVVVNGRVRENLSYMGARAVADRELLVLMKQCFQSTFLRATPLSLLKAHPDFDGSDPWSWGNVFLVGDVGPGSALESTGTSWYDKFYQSPLSFSSPKIWREYRRRIPLDSLRARAEDQRDAEFGHVEVRGGKYSSVPKSWKTDRSIDIQPSVNMWAQKGLACIIGAFVQSKYGVNLSIQPFVNRELARRGSIRDDLATIDLSEASNRIPWEFVDWMCEGLPMLDLLAEARCWQILLPWDQWMRLHMCSGMGNGFTFSLMTALNLAAVEAVMIYRGKEFKRLEVPLADDSWSRNTTYFNHEFERFTNASSVLPHLVVERALDDWANTELKNLDLPNWGVFGDDIICHSAVYDDLVRLLGLCNARVNLDKSYSRGNFRESCGGDYWLGTDVRAVYATTLAEPHDRVSLLNRLLVWSAKHEIPLVRTCKLLWSSCKKHVSLVPLHESDHAGLRVPEIYARPCVLSHELKDLETALQRPIRPYNAFVPRVRVKTFTGAQVEIYGLGILLSMIRRETTSQFAHADVTASRLKRSDLSVPPDRYSLSIRENGQVTYEARWCWSAGWDRTFSTLPNARQMDRALSINLGLALPSVNRR